MTKSPPQEHHIHPSTRKRLWLQMLSRGGLALGGILLVGLIGGVWRLRTFVEKELTPLAEKNLTTTLNRPVKLGGVTKFSLTGVEFGASAIRATPTDPDRVAVEAVEVGFDLSQLIFHRQLKLDVTLVNPDVYIEQDDKGRWISTTIAPPGKPGAIKTDLDKLHFRNGKLALLPQKRDNDGDKNTSPVAFSQVNGSAQLLNNNQQIRFEVGGQANNGGNISIQGETLAKVLAGTFQLQGQELLAADITHLVKLPFNTQAGRVNSNLQIQLAPQQQPLLFGSADLKGVNLQLTRVPQPFNNSQGTVRFQGMEVQLDNIATNYGKIPLVTTGIIDRQTGYKLAGQVKAVSVADAQETLKLKLPVPVTGQLQANLQMVGSITEPILAGTVATIKTARIDKIDFNNISSKFKFSPKEAVITLRDIQGQAKTGGEIIGGGTIQMGKNPQLDFNFSAKNISGDAIAKVYDTKTTFKIGTVSATAQLIGAPSNVQTVVQWQAPGATYPATGETVITPDRTVSFRNVALNFGGGMVRGTGSYANQRWQAVAQASAIGLEPFVDKSKLQNVSLNGAQFNGRLLLTGTTAPFKIASIRTEDAGVDIGGGRVAVSNLQLQDQSFSAQLIANGVRLSRILKQSSPILTNPLAGTFQIAGDTKNFSLKTLRASGEANLNIAGGKITASNIQLADSRYQALIKANGVPVQRLAAVPPQFQGALNGQLQVAGSVESFQPQTIQARGEAQINIAGGKVTASNIQLADGRYQAVVNAVGVKLNQVNQQLRGEFGGKFQVAGTLGGSILADVRAAGQVLLSQGIPGIERPLTAAIAWNGQKLAIERATAPGLNISGDILANANTSGTPEITGLNLSVQAQNYNLQQLPVNILNQFGVKGTADFNGQITGKLPLPNVTGQINLHNLVVQDFAFESLLAGNIQSGQGRGLNLNLAGISDGRRPAFPAEPSANGDRLAFNLDENNRPQSFLVKWQQALASGQTQGDNLALKVENFPLKALNLNPPASARVGTGKIAGLFTGDLQINQQTLATIGNVAIAQPVIGRIKGDRLTAQFRYGNNQATLTSSEFVKGNSRYGFVGTFAQTSKTPRIKGKISIIQGNIQDVLTVAQVFDFKDLQRGAAEPNYGKAADLTTNSQGLPDQSLLTQIKRFYEIDALLGDQEQQRRDTTPIPELADLKGIFNGEVAVDTAAAKGIGVQFNLNGDNFIWGKKAEPNRFYTANKVIAEGSFENGVLQLRPLRVESQNSLLAFTGNIGGNDQSGQLRVNNFPIELLNNFVKLPLGIAGNLDATAALAGSVANPQAKGELQITQGTLNQKAIESATASFSYANGRLNFGSNVSVAGPEPVSINGSIPYSLPFASVTPDNEQISLNLKVANEGLTLLNLLTNQIAFESGIGQVDIKVGGTTQQPKVNGIASVNNATFIAQALPGKLTDVTGKLQFDFDRILVENLQGKFSRGKIEAAGEIPISNNQETTINNPLTVNLDKLVLNFKGLYQGGASGNLQITGSAFNPIVGGKVNLFNGQVLLAESTNNTQPANVNLSLLSLKTNKQNERNNKIANGITRFNNLDLELGKNVQVSRPPILSFRATGNLTVNGSFSDPIPDGTIRLEQGGVNLFTTQFSLARGYKHTATFRANQPRDPDLDIRLFAKVLDGVQSNDFSRLNSTPVSSLETVRVEANIKGLASQLNEKLELTSSPSRSETEIVALLGGGSVDTQGGDSTLGLINIAGSAVFNNFQGAFNQIGTAFGLSELRIFPTVISNNPEAGKTSSTLELAAEAGIDISPKVSVSSIKILTADDPFQWGLNYRINDEFRVRASTNLTDDSRAVVEFQRRF